MATILIKKRDTTGNPGSGDLTNSTGGAELAVNTFDKRLFTKDSGGNVVELGTTPSSITTTTGTITTVNSTTVDTTNIEVTNIKANDGTASVSIADTTGIPTISKATVISTTDNTNAALRITQLGTGNALVVEDSTNPDSTPFVVDSGGNVIVGYSSNFSASGLGSAQFTVTRTGATSGTGASVVNWYNGTVGAGYQVLKSRGGASGTYGIVSSGDTVGGIYCAADDGSSFIQAASVVAQVDGTPGTNDMPGRLVFSTTADGASSPTERMRIDSRGNVGIGGTSATGRNFSVLANLTGSTNTTGVYVSQQIQSDVTSNADIFTSAPTTAAASFTLTNLRHFRAFQSTIGAGATVTNQYGFEAGSTLTGATNNYGFYSQIPSGAGRWNFYAAGAAANYFAGTIASLGSYTATTANAANMNIDSSGNIARSTSSIRYKKDVETLESQYADAFVAQARPVWYRSKSGADNANWGWYGLIAEEVAEIDPRLVHWGYPMKTVEHEPAVEAKEAVFDEEGNEVEPAVQAQEATYKEVPDTDAELQAEGVQYDRLTVLLLDVVKRQNESIKALEARVAALETGA